MSYIITSGHRSLNCTGFPSGFSQLLKVTTIDATRLELARSLITLGPSHRSHHLNGPFWWSLRGVSTIFSLLSCNLAPTHGFMGLSASQRKSDAFLLGEALTHWFAQTHLGAKFVVPLEAHTGSWLPASVTASYPKPMPKYFRHSVKPGAKSEPDFLAFSGFGQVHVLESKGRACAGVYGVTEKDINAARNKALRQACKVATVNGLSPVTRTACVFGFDRSGMAGQITDPPASRPYHYTAEWPQLVRQAYATVLDPLFEIAARDIGDGFIGIEFMPGWKFGIDRHVYKLVQDVKNPESAGALLNFLGDFTDDSLAARSAENRSVGKDGLILVGSPDYSETPWHRELT